MNMRKRLTALTLGVLLCSWALGAASAPASTTATLGYTGGEQTFAVPAGVSSVHVVAIGGRGGSGYAQGPGGGSSAEVTADLSVTPGEVLYVEVGGPGGDGDVDSPGDGGFNGGAAGGSGSGGGGGGGSDVRSVSRSASGSLSSRLITAAGGGGSAGNPIMCNGVAVMSGGAGGAAEQPGAGGGPNMCGGGAASAVGWAAGGGDPGTSSAGGAGGMSAGDGLSFFELDPGADGSVGSGGAGAGGQGGGGGGGGGYLGGGGGGGGVIDTATMAGGGGGGGGGSSFLAEGTSGGSMALDATGVPSVRISYDGTADPSPTVTLAAPADGSSTDDPTPTFSGSAGTAPDDAPTVTVKVYAARSSSGTPIETQTASRQPDGSWAAAASPSLADGTYTAQAEESDAAGNTGLSSSNSFTVDTTPPDTAITSGPSGPNNDPDPSYSFGGSDVLTPTSDLVYAVKLDDGSWSAFSPATSAAPAGAAGLADGPHSFYVKARDRAGNEDATPAVATLVVDTFAPSGSVLVNGGALRTRTQAVTLSLNARDPSPATGVTQMRIANSQTALAAATWAPYASQKSWTLAPGTGTKTVYVQYRDAASNVSPAAQDSIAYRSS
jgi:hypothetical protein